MTRAGRLAGSPWGRGVAAGLLLTAALPPFGWWPLAVAGAALLAWSVDGLGLRARLALGSGTGAGLCLPGLWWMTEFSLPGFVLASLLEACLVALVAVLTPARCPWALPAAMVASDAVRGAWPFGGVPIATLGQTQLGGPFDDVARLGGALGITAVLGTVALAPVALRRARPVRAGIAVAAGVAAAVAASWTPLPEPDGALTAALVQGGGPRGTRAVDSDADVVTERHLAASERVGRGVDLVLWPEDVLDIAEPVERSEAGEDLAGLAVRTGATVVAGVVTDTDGDRFDNEAVAWGADGELVDRYQKNQRVPFGEFIPWRSLVERIADVSAVPRDATVGTGPGLLDTDVGELGVVISYEVFFARRARDAVRAGGEVLLVPTNASSYSSTQMPALEVGVARLRAIETGRDVLQAAPTGFTAAISARGRVMARTDLGDREVLTVEVPRRRGETPYTRLGDGPFVVVAAAALAVAAWRGRRSTGGVFAPARRGRRRRP